MRILSSALLAAAIMLPATVPTASNAQTSCADRTVITERLAKNYGEKFTGGGLRNSESIFEVWMSDETGSWTIIMTRPDGKACVMAAGTPWRDALPETPAGIPG